MQYSREKGAGTREQDPPPLPLPFQALLDELVWYTGGPSVQFLPLPVPVPLIQSDLGDLRNHCKNCNGFCTGHFMCLEKVLATDSSDLPAAHTYPPSTVIKKSFAKALKRIA